VGCAYEAGGKRAIGESGLTAKSLQSPSRHRVFDAMQAARFEGSLMTSLAELKNIEQQRLADERAAVIRADELRKHAAAEAERTAREESERKLREEREAAIAIEQAKVAAERELRLRVEQAEQAERARQMMALEQERQQQEMELRRAEVAKKRPKWMMAVTGLALALAAVLVVFTVKAIASSDEALTAKEQSDLVAKKASDEAEKMRAELDKLETDLRALDGNLKVALDKVAIAQTKAEADAAAKEVKRIAKEKADANAAAAAIRRKQELDKRMGGAGPVCTGSSICREDFNKK
jgi:colicin import membrane protein